MIRKLLILSVLIILPICIWADNNDALKYDFVVDNIYYRYNPDQTSVAVTYKRKYSNDQLWNVENSYSGEVTIPQEVTYNDVTYPVTKIDKYAFSKCYELTAVHIPNTITEIGNRAFWACSALLEINLPSSLVSIEPAFSGCSSLKEMVIPANIKNISGFSSCTALETVELPAGLEILGEDCFNNCSSLKNITLPSSLTRIDARAFTNCKKVESITIPETVNYVGSRAFSGCSGLNTVNILCELRQVDISDEGQVSFLNVDKENNRIFENCGELVLHVTHPQNAIALLYTNAFRPVGEWQVGTTPHFYVNDVLMTDFEIPNIDNKIPSSSFLGVTDMKTLTLPQGLKYIGINAFRGCSALEKVDFPEALEIIDEFAFLDCTSLKEIKFGKNIKELRDEAFINCKALEKVDIGDLANWCSVSFPDGRINGAGDVPSGCKTNNPLVYAKKIYLNGQLLDELIIPSGLTTINPHVFNNCQRFDKLVIPSSVTSIGDYAFASCGDLDNIVFKSPVNLESIGVGVFDKCISLTNVSLPDCITSLGAGVFRGCANLTSIKIPAGLDVLPASIFYDCTSLPSVDLPETLTTIGNYAFYNCSALTRIDIPASVEYIGTEPFRGTTSLQGVYIKDMAAWCNIKYGNQQDGGGWGYELKESNPLIRSNNLYLNGELVTDLVIPEGVETIESCAFWGGTCIKSVKLPSTLKTIKDHAFWYTKIRDVMIPNSVESIGEEAFALVYYLGATESINVCLDNLEQWFRNYGQAFRNSAYYRHLGTINIFIKGGSEPIPNANNVPMFDGLMAKKVEDLVVPNSITNLDSYALAALSLNSVTLHKEVESVKSSTFDYTLVNYIYSQAKFPPSIYNGSSQTTALISYEPPMKAIYVPLGRGDSYRTKWSGHADIIIEADPEMSGVQSAESISEMRSACAAMNGTVTYLDLTNATLDETVTADALGAGEDNVLYYLPSGTTTVTGSNIVVDGVAESVCLHDGASMGVPMEFTSNQVNYLRVFSAGDSHTLCLPFDMTLPEGVKAYSLSAKTEDGKLRFIEAESVKANKPYVIVTNSDVENLNANNVKMEVTPDDMEDAGITDYEFRGTLQEISNEEAESIGAYALQKNFIWKPVAEGPATSDIAAGRAYLVPSSGSAAPRISCVISGLLIKGDANGDGSLDINDALCIVNYLTGNPVAGFNAAAADVNGDGQVTIADAVEIVNILVKE